MVKGLWVYYIYQGTVGILYISRDWGYIIYIKGLGVYFNGQRGGGLDIETTNVHLRVENLMLQVITSSLKIWEAKERAVSNVTRGCGHNGVLDCPTAPEYPHEVSKVIWGHRLIQCYTNLDS